MTTIYTTNGPARVTVYRNERNAIAARATFGKPARIMLGNYDFDRGGEFLVCTPRDAERLYRDGYEYHPAS